MGMRKDTVWNGQKQNGHNGNGNRGGNGNGYNGGVKFVRANAEKVAVALVFETGIVIPEFGLGVPARVLENRIGRNVVLGANGDLRCAVPEAREVARAVAGVRNYFTKKYIRKPGARVREVESGKISQLRANGYDTVMAACDELVDRLLPARNVP